MAEKKVIEIDVNTKDAVKAMDNLSKATHDVSKSFEEVYGDLQPLTTRMGEAEDRLYELANAGKTTTQEYKDLLKTVGDYRKVQIQTDLAVDAAATTMGQKLGGALGGVTSGFSVAQGAMGALGSESAELEKTLLKVQSALAIQQGFQGIKEAIPSFVQLKNSAVGAFQGMTTASKAFAATGIGLLITAVALLVTNMDDIKKSFNSGLASAQKYADSTEKQAEAARRAVDNFDEYARTLRRVGFEEDEINNKRKAAFAKAIRETENQLKAQKKLLSESKKGLETAQAFDAFGLNATGRWLYGDEEDVKANRTKAKEIADQLTKLKNDKYEFDAEAKKAKEDAKKEAEETRKEQAKENSDKRKEALEQIRQNNREATDLFKSEYDKQVRDIKEKYDAQIALAKKYKQDTVDLEKARKQELQDLEDKQAKDVFDNTEKLVVLRAGALSKTKQFQEQEKAGLVGVGEVRKRISDAEQKIADEKKANLQQALEATAATLGQISELLGKQTKAGKVAAIAEATIQTFLSAQKAYAATIGVPVVGPVLAPINAGLAIAAGFKNIKSIAAVKVPNDTGGGGNPPTPSTGGGSIISPNFNVVGNSGVNQLASLQQQPVQAYVVSGQITSQQSLDRNRKENATL
jgi:hypothetical protein